jgi:isopentenyl-diphosphate delta-isomerase
MNALPGNITRTLSGERTIQDYPTTIREVEQMNNEMVILVDKNDKKIGIEEKMKTHKEGKLHRAFSIFIFNAKKQMLLQRRAESKYYSGGLWSNACCGHPRPGEGTEQAAHRRLKEELGFDCELKELFQLIYKAKLDHGLTEHEFDHIFIGNYDGIIEPNMTEVSATLWQRIDALKEESKRCPQDFTEWFKIALRKFYDSPRNTVVERNVSFSGLLKKRIELGTKGEPSTKN